MNTLPCKFLCDQMLLGIGKWLRIAGYDTLSIDTPMKHGDILKYAHKENRLLLTCNRHLVEIKKDKEPMLYLASNSIPECIKQLNHTLHINWLYRPFTRCVICNTELEELSNQDLLTMVPPQIQLSTHKFLYCSHCNKVYWEGSHTKRMSAKLRLWQTL